MLVRQDLPLNESMLGTIGKFLQAGEHMAALAWESSRVVGVLIWLSVDSYVNDG